MADDLHALESWLDDYLAALSAGARTRLAQRIGIALRRSQAQRIARQQDPDGTPFAARKVPLRTKTGRIKRNQMFGKIRSARYMRVHASAGGVEVGFTGAVARIARVHQEGGTDEVRPGGPRARYEQRRLLGFSRDDLDMIRELVIKHLASV